MHSSLLFASKEPLNLIQIKKAINETGNILSGVYKQYSKVNEQQIEESLKLLEDELSSNNLGKLNCLKLLVVTDYKIIYFAVHLLDHC